MIRTILIAIAFLSCVSAERQGRVVKVVDGDTFDILEGNTRLRVRLFGIDSPERGQPFNKKAKEFTASLIADKNVRLVIHNKDRYGRSVAEAYLADGTYVNAEIVKAGFAWQFKRYSDDNQISKFEKEARQARRGLWEEERPVAPWEFRARGKKAPVAKETTSDLSDFSFVKSLPVKIHHRV